MRTNTGFYFFVADFEQWTRGCNDIFKRHEAFALKIPNL